jgi:hypothetical protein
LAGLESSEVGLSLEKSWHGLHYVLTGSAWEGTPPLNFLVSGGQPVGDEEDDVGYGPARVIDPESVAALHAVLSTFPQEQFESRLDPEQLESAEIYPGIWDEPVDDLREEYGEYFASVKDHVRRAAESGQALVIAIR